MNIFHAIILGIVEGVTEFLPISSTFHIIWVSKLLQIQQTEFVKLFEVVIQSGAIFSVLFLYLKTFTKDHMLFKKTLAAFIPTAFIGFISYKLIKDVFFTSSAFMLAIFIIVGIIFIVYEIYISKQKDYLHKTLDAFSYTQALLIGCIQSLAVMPGVSRAGAVIVGMLLLRYRRDEATKFSFLLSVPTIFAASGYDVFKMRHVLTSSGSNIVLLLIGFISAFISSYFVIKWFIRYVQNHSLSNFGWYRIVVGLALSMVK